MCFVITLLYEFVLHSVMPVRNTVGLKIREKKGLVAAF